MLSALSSPLFQEIVATVLTYHSGGVAPGKYDPTMGRLSAVSREVKKELDHTIGAI